MKPPAVNVIVVAMSVTRMGVTLNHSGLKNFGLEKLWPERLGPERQTIVHRNEREEIARHFRPMTSHL